MKVLDLFSGTGSSTDAFADRGHRVYHVELNQNLADDLAAAHGEDDVWQADVFDITAAMLRYRFSVEHFDFIWASPPCTAFSVASIGHHWKGSDRKNKVPATPFAAKSMELVDHTLTIIRDLAPAAWVMENPRGLLRTLPPVAGIHRETVTYCQYGDTSRMKPTDLWGGHPEGWHGQACRNGDTCHTAAPRGSTTGTQGLSKIDKARVPYGLSLSLCEAMERQLAHGTPRPLPPERAPDLTQPSMFDDLEDTA